MERIGVETWRGSVRPWHIDEMGHMNIRHYLAIAGEGLVGLAGALGMPRAFAADASATLQPREHHVRFLKEARVGTALHMDGAVLEMDETGVRVLQVLVHSGSGEPAAAIVSRLEHVTPRQMRSFPFSKATRALAEDLKATAPDYALPRGLVDPPRSPPPASADAEALGFKLAAAGAVMPADADVFGLMRSDHVLDLISQAMPHRIERVRGLIRRYAPDLETRLGGATVELRLVHRRWPRVGERLELRSGLTGLTAKVNRLAHWLLDPATGDSWAEVEMLTVNFDLQARKAVELPAEVAAALAAELIGTGSQVPA